MSQQKTPVITELWQTTQNWLSLFGNKPSTKYCREEITTHPDYPAITAVTDFLDSGNMRYQVVEADASYIHEFNYPLLAHIRQPGQEYLSVIPNAAQWDRQKEITQHWSGITIFPEKNSQWYNEQNSAYKKEAVKNKIFAVALTVVGLVLLLLSVTRQSHSLAIAFALLSLLGLIISAFLLGTELGFQSQVVKQVCGAVSSGGCEKVLKSKYAKGIAGVTPADASVLYFGTQFIFYLLSPYSSNLLPTIVCISIIGVLIAAWSLYTQGVKLKQWCALCLGIVAVLVLQTATALAFLIPNFQYQISNYFTNPIYFLYFITLSSFLYFLLSPIKQLIKTNNTNRQKVTELKKWKTDAALFTNLWQQGYEVDNTIWKNDLLLGDPEAPILITVACNPYCGPCAKAHKELDDLLFRNAGKVKVLIRLLCNPDNETDKRTVVVKAILQNVEIIKKNTEMQQMLSDWFNWMDFEKWNAKWQKLDFATDDKSVEIRLKQHIDWVNKANISGTPTFFINGRKLPGRYNLKDIEILIPQLAQILTNELVK